MRKVLQIIVAIVMLIGFSLGSGWTVPQASAAESEPQIADIIGKDTFLLDDGTLWSLIDGDRKIRTVGKLTSITGTEYSGHAISQEGQLMEWSVGSGPRPIAGMTGVKQVSGGYWLKNDGTVWSGTNKVKGLDGILMIGHGGTALTGGGKSLGALTRNGEVLIKDHYTPGKNLILGTIANVDSVKSIAVYEGRVALLYVSGEVVVYEASNFDDNGKIIPVTVAQDAAHITYTSGKNTAALLVTRKDGTLWKTGEYQARWKLDREITGLGTVVKTASYLDADHFYAKRSDGSWVLYDDTDIKPVDVPKANKVDVTVSELKPFVGDSLNVNILETYTNGAKIKVVASESNVVVDKPHLLQLQPNGSFKVTGVGQIQVTVTTSGISKSLTVSASLRNNLKYSKQLNGNVYVPAKTVIQALGGTLASAAGSFEAKIGDTTLTFKVGEVNATLSGEPIQLKVAPLADKGDTLIPASLLSEALGAKVKWDAKWKWTEITFGEAKMTVVSVDTAAIIKKAMQGSLARFIGKSYWNNYYEDWERFSKVTVTDIVPDDSGAFVVMFKNASGKTLKGYPTSSSFIEEIFTDEHYLFSYDPKKKYPWSASIWNQIKAGKVSLGMTKDQVKLSWGYPAGKSITSGGGKTVETWVYSNFNTVAFINGKVSLILL